MVVSLGGPDIRTKTPEIPEKIQIPPINLPPREVANTDTSGVMSLLHGVPICWRLRQCKEEWQKIGAPLQVISWICFGLDWQFDTPPIPKRFPEAHLSAEQQAVLNKELKRLFDLGCFEALPAEDIPNAIIAYFFVVPKSDGGWRPVIDLTYANSFSGKIHFKMENIKDVRDLIRPFDFMITIDLKDAYCHLFYNQKSRKFAAFSFQGSLFQCVAMLFGVTHGPRWWTKVLRPIVKFFRSKGIRCVVYIDDFIFFLGPDLEVALGLKDWIMEALLKLGLSINVKKSSLMPSLRVKFLGFIIDSKKMRLFAPETKITEIKKMSKKLHKQGQCSIRVLASFLGKISAAAQAVLPWRLCTRELLLNKNKILKMVKNWDTEVVLTDDALLELKFWADKIQDFNGKDIQVEEPSWVTISDSSQQSFTGMELASEDPFIIVKDWDMDSQRMHNNYLETLALSFRVFSPSQTERSSPSSSSIVSNHSFLL